MKVLIAIGMSLLVSAYPLSVYAEEIKNEAYLNECGVCHFAYPPMLLPKSSWKDTMKARALANHFGERVKLPKAGRIKIEDFLLVGAGDGDEKNGPLRITETEFFRTEHEAVSRRFVQDNSRVNSFSNCDSCHTQAAKGNFDEDFVTIPGFGSWRKLKK